MKFSFIFATFALPSKAVDWSSVGYKKVIDDIAKHGFEKDGLLQNMNETVPPEFLTLAVPNPYLDPNFENRKIRMEYNFNPGDIAFSGLLSSELVGDPKYNLQQIKSQADLPKKITIPRSTANYSMGSLPWSCVAGQRLDYLKARKDQWSISLPPYSDDPLNPWRRNAAIVGMDYDIEQGVGGGGKYANNYVVTFDVDRKYVLRPNYHQLPWMAEAKSGLMTKSLFDLKYHVDPAWSKGFVDSAQSAVPVIYAEFSSSFVSMQSDLVRSQWEYNVIKEAGFPYTGIGYTYDWYYQNRTEWSQGNGIGLAEFIVMPSTATYNVTVDIISVQTTAQLLGARHAFPGVGSSKAAKNAKN
jgi:hypothetical protein